MDVLGPVRYGSLGNGLDGWYEVGFGSLRLDRFYVVMFGAIWHGSLGHVRFCLATFGLAVADSSGEVSKDMLRCGRAVRDGTGWNRCYMERYGTKGVCMNQIMVNAVEFDLILKEIEVLKKENERLANLLKDANDKIRLLKEEVGFAERGYTKL